MLERVIVYGAITLLSAWVWLGAWGDVRQEERLNAAVAGQDSLARAVAWQDSLLRENCEAVAEIYCALGIAIPDSFMVGGDSANRSGLRLGGWGD
jgi:cation transport ATPase